MPISAIVSFGVTAAKTAVSLSAQKKKEKAAKQAADESIALQKEIFGLSKENLQPFITRGNAAGDIWSGLLGIGDGANAKKAFDTYLKSTGYEFEKDQALRAVTSNKAAAGLLNSGATLKAVQKNAADLANTYSNSYLAQVAALSGQGLTAAGNLAEAGQAHANAVTGENNYKANAIGEAALGKADAINGLLSAVPDFLSSIMPKSPVTERSSYASAPLDRSTYRGRPFPSVTGEMHT